MTFAQTLRAIRLKAGLSRYRIAQTSGLDQAYVLRLETGERGKPSRDVVLMLGLALMQAQAVTIHDVDELLLAADYAPLRRRGEAVMPNEVA